jgi:hypothetical protein
MSNHKYIPMSCPWIDEYKPTVYAAFCGTGKSYLCNNFPEVYKEIEDWKYRNNSNFPSNYVYEVIKNVDQSKYLFIATDPVILKAINAAGIKIVLVYPEISLRNEYLDRYIERGSSYDFVGTFMINWKKWITELQEQSYCEHKILKSKQFLKDVL